MFFRTLLKSALPALALVGSAALASSGCATASEPAKPIAAIGKDEPAPKPVYPLTTCVVSDEKLGEMGKPVIIDHEGREVRFCCSKCIAEFKKDPAKYLKKIDDAAKK